MKLIYKIIPLIVLLAAIFLAGKVFAQSEEVLSATTTATPATTGTPVTGETPQKYGITFPVAELGNCADFASCRTYCDDPTHSTECIAFAKKKGFYKEPTQADMTKVVASAKTELGCDSEDSCKSFCSQDVNFQKCSDFAKKAGLQGGVKSAASSNPTLAKAKEILGCTSVDACKTFCSEDANKQKCSDFAKQAGLRGGEQKVGPGGCTSEDTCKAFCSSPVNSQLCGQFKAGINPSSNTGQKFGGSPSAYPSGSVRPSGVLPQNGTFQPKSSISQPAGSALNSRNVPPPNTKNTFPSQPATGSVMQYPTGTLPSKTQPPLQSPTSISPQTGTSAVQISPAQTTVPTVNTSTSVKGVSTGPSIWKFFANLFFGFIR